MDVSIPLPEHIAQRLQASWKDVPAHMLQAVAIEGYRSGALSEYEVQQMLESIRSQPDMPNVHLCLAPLHQIGQSPPDADAELEPMTAARRGQGNVRIPRH